MSQFVNSDNSPIAIFEEIKSRQYWRTHIILLTSAASMGLSTRSWWTFQDATFEQLLGDWSGIVVFSVISALLIYGGWISYSALIARYSGGELNAVLRDDALTFLPLVFVTGSLLKHFGFQTSIFIGVSGSGFVAMKCYNLFRYRLLRELDFPSQVSFPTVLALAATYALSFSVLGFRRYSAFGAHADHSLFTHQFWGFAHLDSLVMPTKGYTFFGDHFSPILPLISSTYWVFAWIADSATILLILQSLVLSLGAIPIYRLARDAHGSTIVGLVFSVSYLLYPAIQNPNVGDFHESLLIATPLLYSFYYLERREYRTMIVFLILALMCKEDVPLITGMMGLYLFFVHRARRLGIQVVTLSGVWFLLALFVVIPYFRDNSLYWYLQYFESTTDQAIDSSGTSVSVLQLIASELHIPNAVYLLQLLAPVGFMSLIAPGELLIGVPVVLELMFYDGPPFGMVASVNSWHTVAVVPWIFIAAIKGSARLGKYFDHHWPNCHTEYRQGIAVFVLASSLFSSSVMGVLPYSINHNYAAYVVDEHAKTGHQIVDSIPEDAPVATTSLIASHLAEREWIFILPEPFEKVQWRQDRPFPVQPEYVLIDTSRYYLDKLDSSTRLEYMDMVADILATPRFYQTVSKDGYILLEPPPNPILDPR